MNFIGAVTIATAGKLQEFFISMETPSLTAVSAGSAADFVFVSGCFPRVDAGEIARSVPLDRTLAADRADGAPGFRGASQGAQQDGWTCAIETILLRNGQLGPRRQRMGPSGGPSPRRSSGIARRSSATAVG
jgi:hypothetical protein